MSPVISRDVVAGRMISRASWVGEEGISEGYSSPRMQPHYYKEDPIFISQDATVSTDLPTRFGLVYSLTV
jgi:hypothetical protein